MTWYRHADPRYPFLWESGDQPPARWHGPGEGPAHYFSDTPEGAWAEYLRHEEITEVEDLPGIRRSIWAVEVPDGEEATVARGPQVRGGLASYDSCRAIARRLRRAGHTALRAPAAAVVTGGAHGWRVDGGVEPGPPRAACTLVLFGRRPDLIGWSAAHLAQPDPHILSLVRPLSA